MASAPMAYLLGRLHERRVVDRVHDMQHELLTVQRLGHHHAVHLGRDLRNMATTISIHLVTTVIYTQILYRSHTRSGKFNGRAPGSRPAVSAQACQSKRHSRHWVSFTRRLYAVAPARCHDSNEIQNESAAVYLDIAHQHIVGQQTHVELSLLDLFVRSPSLQNAQALPNQSKLGYCASSLPRLPPLIGYFLYSELNFSQ